MHGHFLASHTDREQVVDTLKAAFVEGRLTKDELDVRAGQAFTARTYADLAVLTADIPAGPTGSRRRPARVQARPPVSKRAVMVQLAAFAIIPPIVIVVAAIVSHNHGVASATLPPLALVYLMALLIGLSHLVGSRLEQRHSRRSGGQLPPRPGPGGQVLEGGQHGRARHDPVPPEPGPIRSGPTYELTTHGGTGRWPPRARSCRRSVMAEHRLSRRLSGHFLAT
jgi:DUF1707 SHOCT-like domain